jgi:hypothetical protein
MKLGLEWEVKKPFATDGWGLPSDETFIQLSLYSGARCFCQSAHIKWGGNNNKKKLIS